VYSAPADGREFEGDLMGRSNCFVFALFASAALAIASARAQEVPDVDSEPILDDQAESRPTVTLRFDGSYTFGADLDGGDGEVAITRAGAVIGLFTPIAERLTLNTRFGFEYSNYDWDDANIEGTDSPFSDVYSGGVFAVLQYEIDPVWSVNLAGFVAAAGEAGADVDDAIFGGGGLSLGWRPSDRFFIAFGADIRTRLEDDPIVTPQIIIRWQATDDLRVETVDLPQGAGLGVTTDFADAWAATLYAGISFRQYRLDDDHPGKLADAAVTDTRVPVGLRLTWTPSTLVSLSIDGGVVVYQEYEFIRSNGVEFHDVETDPAPYIGLLLTLRF